MLEPLSGLELDADYPIGRDPRAAHVPPPRRAHYPEIVKSSDRHVHAVVGLDEAPCAR